MIKRSQLYGQAHAILAILLVTISTFFCFLPILILGLFKLLPFQKLKIHCMKGIDQMASLWMGLNNQYLDSIHPVRWQIGGCTSFNPQKWQLVVANHQSWLDILILHRIFNRKIPVLKFFVKDSLKWIPLLGFAWWAMGCPFMKRYSKKYLEKYPHKKGQDIIRTQKALKLFHYIPTSVMNFIEGTRYKANKAQLQQSPYKNLLRPKSGGISFVISALNEKITHLLDVTILYPETTFSLWSFLCRRFTEVKVYVREIEIPAEFLNARLAEDQSIQEQFRHWLNQQWAIKDQLIEQMKAQSV